MSGSFLGVRCAVSVTVHVRAIVVNASGCATPERLEQPGSSLRDVDVRIGVTQAPRELSIELDDDVDRDDLKSRIEAALAGAADVLWVTDKRGKDIGVPAAKIAYVELGSADGDRRIGFGG
jgi:hypothetical protein